MPFKSIDTIVDENETVNFPAEFLNSLDISGMPPHYLLKIGSFVILLCNLNSRRLSNGTHLAIERIIGKFLQAIILTVKLKGEIVQFPRAPLIPSKSSIPFKRLRFPIRLVFVMIINKFKAKRKCPFDAWTLKIHAHV
ncbi:ATP-dependent DNA helicase [Trichonephila clavipes]|nr:ATP-dependent DNA helicase [Trichonephila clavipes]